MNIEDKIMELLEERGFVSTLKRNSQNWHIFFSDKSGAQNLINKATRVSDLWWLTEAVGDEAPKTPFNSWLVELEGFFKSTYGMSHKDFEDYNWFEAFDNDVSPSDAFDEWRVMNEAGTLGG